MRTSVLLTVGTPSSRWGQGTSPQDPRSPARQRVRLSQCRPNTDWNSFRLGLSEICAQKSTGGVEAPLEQHLKDTLKNPLLSLVYRFTRINLGSWGTLSDEHAGVISVLAQQTTKLTSAPTDIPVVCLESDNGNNMIQEHEGIAVAVHEMAS
ncbi:ragulator complex protein LAMTOR5-like [Vulpes lagopus]|uniref:ragulator complex protein LAMTOR5-like n=1 Tax=Vulpes lagopus TaxID=494514 RepID=UPI001BCA34E1|nr:ragulator complex protein LAMTOR5-like [Vulpes lagopus]